MSRFLPWLLVACLFSGNVFAASTVPAYFYPTDSSDFPTLSSNNPSIVTEAFFKAVQMNPGDAISATLPDGAGHFFPYYWSGSPAPLFTASIVSDPDYAFTANTATLVQQALTTNNWTSAFTGGITVDSELSYQGAGVASLGGNTKDFFTSMRQFANASGKPFSFYLGARYLGADGDPNNPDYVADILGSGSQNYLLMPTYADQTDHDSLGRLTNAVSELSSRNVSYKWILEVDSPTSVFDDTVTMLLDPSNGLVNPSRGYAGIALYPFSPDYQSNSDITANLAYLNSHLSDFNLLTVPEPDSLWLLFTAALAMFLVLRGNKTRVIRFFAFGLLVAAACREVSAGTYPQLDLMMQAESDYSAQTATDFAAANPGTMLFREYGPASSDAASIDAIKQFVQSLGSWSGNLWYTPDATKADYGDWSQFGYSTADSYKAYVDNLSNINAALSTAGLKTFSGIFLETEGSYLGKDSATLGPAGLVRTYLDDKSLNSVKIGTTGAWTTAGNLSVIGVDLLAIQVYNLDSHESELNYSDTSPTGIKTLADNIAQILETQYTGSLGDLTQSGVNLMFSYESQFFGQSQWTVDNFNSFLSDFSADLPGTSLGIYSSTDAFTVWNAGLTEVPEPGVSGLLLAAASSLLLRRLIRPCAT